MTTQSPASLAAAGAAVRTHPNRWWQIVGGVSMNLAFGSLYGWSVFVAPLEKQFGWKRADTSMVFTIAVFVTAFTFILGGWINDRWGPRFCTLSGGLLLSLGFYLCAFTRSLTYLFVCFGVIGGFGSGLGCAVIIPVVAKWFADKRGLAIGLIIGAYGGGSALFGPLSADYLIPQYGLAATFKTLGEIFLLMTMLGAWLLKNPRDQRGTQMGISDAGGGSEKGRDVGPAELLRTPAFYFMWLAYAFGCSSGLMVISQLVPFATSVGISSSALAAMAIVVGAMANTLGRVLSGWLSDALGRMNVLRLMIAISIGATPTLYLVGRKVGLLYLAVFLIYYCYGTQLSVNAAACSDFWGVRNAGMNYGLLFTAWGVAGVIGPRLGGMFFDRYHNYRLAFYSASCLAIAALAFELVARPESEAHRRR